MAKKDREDIDQDDQETSVAVNDAWTGMLAISLLALIIGTTLLALDYFSYPSEGPPNSPKIASASPDGGGKPAPVAAPPKDGGKKE